MRTKYPLKDLHLFNSYHLRFPQDVNNFVDNLIEAFFSQQHMLFFDILN